MTELTPFEADIREQPAALRRLAAASIPDGLTEVFNRSWDRTIFTGMGSSHFAGRLTWQTAVAAGRPAWTIDSSQLLDTPGLLTKHSLLIVTSQSGASGEVVELLNRIASGRLPKPFIIGICDVDESPLAKNSDLYVPLHSGNEATVSTKSYLNSLSVHRRIIGTISGEASTTATEQILTTADAVEALIGEVDVRDIATTALSAVNPRVVMIGKGNDAPSALYAGLITKEASKILTEGYIGGQFRHGPMELAGPGLTAILFGARVANGDSTIRRLAADLVTTGATVVLVGNEHLKGALTIPAQASFPLQGLATGAVVAEFLAMELARANSVEPGAFAFGHKITTVL